MAVEFIAQSKLPTIWGEFKVYAFTDDTDNKDHLLLVLGDIDAQQSVLTRLHSECLTGDALFSLRCDCGSQLQEAMRRISLEGSGVIIYLRQEGRGIGLANKIKAYALQDKGLDTVEANIELGFAGDERHYDVCRTMLDYINVTSIQLMTNNLDKVAAFEAMSINVEKRVQIQVGNNSCNEKYLQTKASKLHHVYGEQ